MTGTCLLFHPFIPFHAFIKVKVCFYIAQYPVRWTAQSALHFHHCLLLQAQSEEDDSPQDVAINMDGFMEEFFEQVRTLLNVSIAIMSTELTNPTHVHAFLDVVSASPFQTVFIPVSCVEFELFSIDVSLCVF